jgi:hypothetical protein
VVRSAEDLENGPVIDMRTDFGRVADQEGRCACSAFCRHFEALFKKRLRYGKRDKITACWCEYSLFSAYSICIWESSFPCSSP